MYNKYITLVEIIYIYFMYNVFKTKYSFHHPIEILISKMSIPEYLKHPIYSDVYESKICSFGKYASILLIIWLIIRQNLNSVNFNFYRKINLIIFSLFLIGTLSLNMNSFIYLIPVFIYEFYQINNK